MRLILALGIAFAGLAVSAVAEEARQSRHVFIHRGDAPFAAVGEIDADHDGWVTRAEAAAQAERVFADMDSNDDGKLDDADHFNLRIDGPPEHDVIIRRMGDAPEAGQRVERHVTIIRNGETIEERVEGGDGPPLPPLPPLAPHPPHPPMFVMLFANSEEADLNGDGAQSLEEFRAQHLRFFDASDANGDGRVRFHAPPAPPEPPIPPEGPTPPPPPWR